MKAKISGLLGQPVKLGDSVSILAPIGQGGSAPHYALSVSKAFGFLKTWVAKKPLSKSDPTRSLHELLYEGIGGALLHAMDQTSPIGLTLGGSVICRL